MTKPSSPRTKPIVTSQMMEEYLNTSDNFAFELSTLSILYELELSDIEHSGTYLDSVTGLSRQFDLRASLNFEGRCVLLAIECKNLSDTFPLLVSRVPRDPKECFHEVLKEPDSRLPRIKLMPYRNSANRSFYPSTVSVGKSTIQIGKNPSNDEWVAKDGEVYEKWSQAVSSAHRLLERGVEQLNYHRLNSIVVFPVLVVPDGRLWTCEYDLKGKRTGDVIGSDQVEIFLNHPFEKLDGYKYTISHLHCVTQTGLKSLISKIRDSEKRGTLFV